MPHLWCADAVLFWVAYGTVRLHARSHARGFHLGQALDRPQHSHWRFPSMTLVISQARVGLRAYLIAPRQSQNLNLDPRSGKAQAQPAGIYGAFLHPHVGAVHPSTIPTSPGS